MANTGILDQIHLQRPILQPQRKKQTYFWDRQHVCVKGKDTIDSDENPIGMSKYKIY